MGDGVRAAGAIVVSIHTGPVYIQQQTLAIVQTHNPMCCGCICSMQELRYNACQLAIHIAIPLAVPLHCNVCAEEQGPVAHVAFGAWYAFRVYCMLLSKCKSPLSMTQFPMRKKV